MVKDQSRLAMATVKQDSIQIILSYAVASRFTNSILSTVLVENQTGQILNFPIRSTSYLMN